MTWDTTTCARMARSRSRHGIGCLPLPIPGHGVSRPGLVSRGRDRQREMEVRPRAQLAVDPDLAAVQLDDLAGDRQPKPGADDLVCRLLREKKNLEKNPIRIISCGK